VIKDAVFELNREKNKLGYVHGSAVIPKVNDEQLIIFYGGVTGDEDASRDEKFEMMRAGWKRIIDELTDSNFKGKRLISDKTLKMALRAITVSRSIIPLSQTDRAGDLASKFANYDDPAYQAKLDKIIQELSVEDLRKTAKKYLSSKNRMSVIATKSREPHCVGALKDLAEIRRELSK
jgi:hypothetical protein